MMEIFDKNVPCPKGSSLFLYPETLPNSRQDYKARTFDISTHNSTVEEVVRKCLEYKVIEL
jgi:hypothetical protein